MWQAIIIGAAAIVAVGLAVATVVLEIRQIRDNEQLRITSREAREPDLSSIQRLGNCCYCNGNVDSLSGYALPCSHPTHYTCSMWLKKELGDYTNPNTLCKICLLSMNEQFECSNNSRAALNQAGLRKRTALSGNCANCEKAFTEDCVNTRELACKHLVHQSCWERMEETSTSCPGCMEI